MNWSFRPGVEPSEQLKELGDTLGLQNLKDVSVDTDDAGNTYLHIFTNDKKYKIQMTEV